MSNLHVEHGFVAKGMFGVFIKVGDGTAKGSCLLEFRAREGEKSDCRSSSGSRDIRGHRGFGRLLRDCTMRGFVRGW